VSPIPERASGILLHVSSLPGPHAIGDLGPGAFAFIDWLEAAGQKWWQVLPLGPTGYGESPYQLISGLAGNPLFIDIKALGATVAAWEGDTSTADHAVAARLKTDAINSCAAVFAESATAQQRQAFAAFQAANPWLNDHAIFVTLKTHFDQKPWHEWPQAFALRDRVSLATFANRHAADLFARKLEQFWFFSQWNAVRDYAHDKGINLIGDCPIYVAHDSCEVWCEPELFDLDPAGLPRHIAGVPPDYFSDTGQRWGNPLYLWARHAADDYRWWRQRLAACVRLFDLVRLDHFRAFDAYWSIPASCPTAIEGEWVPGPGTALFDSLQDELGSLPIIAEDLGLLTDSVHALRDTLGLPGMRVLQFGFDGNPDNPHAPHNITENVVCYTGTHDNPTTNGWFSVQDEVTRQRVFGSAVCGTPSDRLIDLALSSTARLAILPMQDVLRLGDDARFNTPGIVGGNWRWRLDAAAFNPAGALALRKKTQLSNR
jgi:4-alpha-glucanotransferase